MKKKLLGASAMPVLALPLLSTPVSAQQAYKVVINHEEQYSIWFADRENALGWKDVGKTCSLQECKEYIEEVWTDMRPLSLRQRMEERGLNKDDAQYKVVINHEEQYSIWLVDQEVPEEWRTTVETCSLRECSAYIEEVWTDMRPLSLRTAKRDGE